MDQSELADLLVDLQDAQLIEAEEVETIIEVDHQENNESSDDPGECTSEEESTQEVPELTSDKEGRPMWSTREPEQYDPSTGESYIQLESCHNITSPTPTMNLEYSESESKLIACLLTRLKAQCHGQQFMLTRGLKEFTNKGVSAAKEELEKMHSRRCFRAIAVKELTRQEKIRAQ